MTPLFNIACYEEPDGAFAGHVGNGGRGRWIGSKDEAQEKVEWLKAHDPRAACTTYEIEPAEEIE